MPSVVERSGGKATLEELLTIVIKEASTKLLLDDRLALGTQGLSAALAPSSR